MTSLYSHDIILVLFQWVIKQDNKVKIITGEWSQSRLLATGLSSCFDLSVVLLLCLVAPV